MLEDDGDAGRLQHAMHLDEELRQLAQDGFALAKAELELQQARAAYAISRAKRIAVLAVLAFVLAFFALVALTVGLVVGLTPFLGAIGATLAVSGGLVLVATIAAALAARQCKRMKSALSVKEVA